MQKSWYSGTQNFVQVNMFACICQPFLTSDNMSDFHFPIINYISKMKGRPTVFFNDNEVIEFSKRHNAIILVYKNRRNLEKITSDSDCIRFSFYNSFLYLLKGHFGAFSIVCSWRWIILFIFFIILRRFEFCLFFRFAVWLCFSLMRTETRVSKIAFEEHFLHVFVEWESLALDIRAVFWVWI